MGREGGSEGSPWLQNRRRPCTFGKLRRQPQRERERERERELAWGKYTKEPPPHSTHLDAIITTQYPCLCQPSHRGVILRTIQTTLKVPVNRRPFGRCILDGRSKVPSACHHVGSEKVQDDYIYHLEDHHPAPHPPLDGDTRHVQSIRSEQSQRLQEPHQP